MLSAQGASVMKDIRQPAVAGTWYPARPEQLAADVDACLHRARSVGRVEGLVGLIAPHAGLSYSGPVAAFAYHQLRDRDAETLVVVGPSHFVSFEGVAVYPRGGFASPFGVMAIDDTFARDLRECTPVVQEDIGPHLREHSLEMQLPFIARLMPKARIVPLLMGRQTDETSRALAVAIATASQQKRVLLIASTDLSHFEDAATAARLDGVVLERVGACDADGLQAALTRNPHHACGGGPTVAVMRASALLGATHGEVLKYGDSGDVSGDKSSVVGYMAAALSRS